MMWRCWFGEPRRADEIASERRDEAILDLVHLVPGWLPAFTEAQDDVHRRIARPRVLGIVRGDHLDGERRVIGRHGLAAAIFDLLALVRLVEDIGPAFEVDDVIAWRTGAAVPLR
jgi:hypothetical protein